jgi:Glycosyl transferase family 2
MSTGASAPGGRQVARPAVSVAVLCRADEPALCTTLGSLEVAAGRLAALGHPVAFSICVNGGEGEAALADARAFAAASAVGPVSILVERHADKARAWNLVRESCASPLVAFCDADVEVAPDALVRLAEALAAAPGAALASARQVPVLDRATAVARSAALPYRFDFGVVGGRLYLMRGDTRLRMPEHLLLEDGWLSAELGRERLVTVREAEVRFRPPATLGDYFRERLRTEAGKVQIRSSRIAAGRETPPIARYPWRDMMRGIAPRDWPLAAMSLGVRCVARVVAEISSRRGRAVPWSTISTSKPPRVVGGSQWR